MNMQKKIHQSREERSTKCFYDAEYWDEYWRKRFNVEFHSDHPVNVKESEKRVNFIKNNYPDVKTMLDVGCGLGYVVDRAKKAGIKCEGIDVSAEAIERAPTDIRKSLRYGTVIKMPYKPQKFELVTVFDLMEHLFIEEIVLAVKEISRVARDYILMRSPLIGWEGERCVSDHSYKSLDSSHVSVYPWDFWARIFNTIGGCFKYQFSAMYEHEERGVVDGWIGFKRLA